MTLIATSHPRIEAPDTTWIYFIQAGDDGPIKIGVARDPDQRLATLQQASPETLRGRTAVWSDPGFERRLHKVFQEARIRGEWFRPVPGLLILIEYFEGHTDTFFFRQNMPPEMEEFVFGDE